MSYLVTIKRIIITVLVIALTVQVIPTNNLKAAQSRRVYVKEFKLFIKEDGKYSDATKWCENQSKKDGETWKAIEGDVNDGANGFFKSVQGVYLCYKTTTNREEAVTDLAVMNERGNYDEGEYKRFLEEQSTVYENLVLDMKEMITKYRENYKNNVETAVQAHDILNGYIEDDSGKKMGDLLLEVSDEDLRDILLQANGEIVLVIENQLAMGAEAEKTTWLDRMDQLGSFTALRKKALTAYNNNAAKADKALDVKYKEDATLLLNSWPDIYETVQEVKRQTEDYGLEKMSKVEIEKWLSDNADDPEIAIFVEKYNAVSLLAEYKYEDGTLFDYFMQKYDDVKGSNIKKLYPLVACLNEAQRASLNQGVSMVQLIQYAGNATVVNENTGKAKEFGEDNSVGKEKTEQAIEEGKEEQQTLIDNFSKNEISVYEGVDREVFTDGVAVTSVAANFSKGSAQKWSDHFVESGQYGKTTLGLFCGTIVSGIGIALSKAAIRSTTIDFLTDVFTVQKHNVLNNLGLSETTRNLVERHMYFEDDMLNGAIYGPLESQMRYREAIGEMYEKGIEKGGQYGITTTSMTVAKYLKIGFTVFTILLAVADIVLTVITLVNYYTRDHLPIPHHMVDLSYGEDKETSYSTYKSVLDNSGKYGDVNAGGGKQWLALYATKDEEAGEPILAPDDELGDIKVVTGDSSVPTGYSPIHLFGTTKAAQNLTFADGESGWSYNDNNNGTYVFFKRAPF